MSEQPVGAGGDGELECAGDIGQDMLGGNRVRAYWRLPTEQAVHERIRHWLATGSRHAPGDLEVLATDLDLHTGDMALTVGDFDRRESLAVEWSDLLV